LTSVLLEDYSRKLVLRVPETVNFIKVDSEMVSDLEGSMSEQSVNAKGIALADASDRVAMMANSSRVKVLALLSVSDRDLYSLLAETRLSKNALVNHLSQLIASGMARRASRGSYTITPEGRRMVDAMARLYSESAIRVDEERRMFRSLYSGSGGYEMSGNKTVSNRALYQPCWVSYNGAMAGCLTALGVECGPVDVGGWSGYAFLVNVEKGRASPAGPTAHGAWPEIVKGTELLGYELIHWFEDIPYPSAGEKPSPQDVERAGRLFDKVRRDIDEHDRPVVLWGLYAPEYGIVNGYDGNSYLVSTFRGAIGQPEGPVLYYDLRAPGCLDMYSFGRRKKISRKEAVDEALARAARFAQGEVDVMPGFVSGPGAITEFADILASGSKQALDYMGVSYPVQCFAESRWMCVRFTQSLAKESKGRRREELEEASRGYAKEAKLGQDLAALFPFGLEGELSAESCRRGTALLRDARLVEEENVKHLKASL